MSNDFNMTAPAAVYRQRRATLARELTRPLVLFSGRARARNYKGNNYSFRASSTYLYFGGPPLEGAALVIEPQSNGSDGCTLLRVPPAADDALWHGVMPDDAAVAAAAGLERTGLADPDQLESVLAGREAAYIEVPCHTTMDWISRVGLLPIEEPEQLAIINMRLIKDEHELVAMRRAAEVTVDAHRAAMVAAVAGQREADVAAAFHEVLVANECNPSFTPIVTVRGEVLHGQSYSNELTDGALLLMDGGAEEPGGYACDVTCTFPVSGRWSSLQQQLYETVLEAMRQAIEACVVGRRYREVHDIAGRVICDGLVQAELLKGDPAELSERRAHTLFFAHGVGHLIGLDVHDMEDFGDLAGYAPGRKRREHFGDRYLRLDRDLEAGVCVTVEPGIYFVPAIWENEALVGPFKDVVNRPAVEALLKARFGGIRIEDTVHVAAGGPETLTAALVRDADEVAKCVGGT